MRIRRPRVVMDVSELPDVCFGPRDIYKHDGVSKVSIVDRRNREAIFRHLNKATSEVCFVSYVPHLGSIFFCYSTGDTDNPATIHMDRCNQAAVYDIADDTWSFIDLPNVSSITMANMDTVLTWDTVPATTTWANIGGTWYDQENTFVKSAVAVSSAVTFSAIEGMRAASAAVLTMRRAAPVRTASRAASATRASAPALVSG